MNYDEDFETPKGTVNVAGKPGAFAMTHEGVQTVIPVRHFGHAVAAAHKTLGVPIPPDERHWLERHDTLPADWDEHGYKLRPGEKGLNSAWVFGNRFVKRVYAPEHTIEPAVSRMFAALHAPHIPVSYAHRGGAHYVHGEYEPGLRSLNEATEDDLRRIPHGLAQHLLLAEWLAAADDRHGGNYGLKPNLVSIDHGYSLGHNPDGAKHANPVDSALWSLLRRFKGVDMTTRLPAASVARARQVAAELAQHALVGNGPEAADNVARRVKALETLPRWGDLIDWTDAANGGGRDTPTPSQIIRNMFQTG